MPLSVESRGNVLILKLIGEPRSDHLDEASQLLEKKIEESGSSRLMVDLRRYDGAGDLRTAWKEFKLVSSHGDTVDKVGVVGSLAWQKLGTLLVSPFTRATERFFEPDQVDAAFEWLRK